MQETRLSRDDLTLRVSRWQRYLYDTERRSNKGLRDAEQAGMSRNDRFPDYQRELFAKLYAPKTPALKEAAEGSEWAAKLHETAQAMPEFQILQERCRGDEVWAGMGTASLAKSITAKMAPKSNSQNVDAMRRRVEGLQKMQEAGVDVSKRLQQAQKLLEQAQQEAKDMAEGLDPVQLRQAVRQGCEQAQQEISDAEQQMDAYSFGSSPGVPVAKGNADQKRELASRIGKNRKLQDIAKLAGRMRRIAAEKQRSKVSDVRNEVSDIEQGDAIERLLPTELMDMINGDGSGRDLLFYRKLLERSCLQYKLSGKDREGRGPIIICCDESGSMSGDPEVWAKSVALALLDIAQRQKRSWVFIHFDSQVSRVDKVKAGAVEQKDVMGCMEYFTGGGTSFQEPLDEAIRQIKADGAMRKADVLFITDGWCSVDGGWLKRFNEERKALEVSVYSVLVNLHGESAVGAVKDFSTKAFSIKELLEQGGKGEAGFTDAVFSI